MTSNHPTLGYKETGSGEPVVLLDWTPWESSLLADSLSSKYRVIAVDPPGTEEGVAAESEVAQAVRQATESAGLTTYTLIGVSLGTPIAFSLALTLPDAVAPLVLVSPYYVQPAPKGSWTAPEQAPQAMLAHPDGGAPSPPLERARQLWQLREHWAVPGSQPAESLSDITCATLVVLGQEDRLVTRKAGGVWKERVANCSVSYVYDAGHAIAIDRPDALANVVLDFIERRETFIVENRSSLITP